MNIYPENTTVRHFICGNTNGELLEVGGAVRLPQFYFYDEYWHLKSDGSPNLSNCYTTKKALGEAHDRSTSWASLKAKDGEVEVVRVYRSQFPVLENEEFRPITSDCTYFLSNHGRIAKQRNSEPVNGIPVVTILKGGTNLNGYKQLPLSMMYLTHFKSSQIGPCVLETFGPPRPAPNSMCIYIDGDHTNLRIENLRWGDEKDRGRKPKGPHIRTDCPVRIVRRSRTGILDNFIGREFPTIAAAAQEIGCSDMNIRQYIKNGKVIVLREEARNE